MSRLTNSLLFRIAALSLLGLVIIQAVILFAAIRPDGRPMAFRLVDPTDAREIAEAVERAPPALRPAIVSAASSGAMTVELHSSFGTSEAVETDLRRAPRIEARFRRYAEELDGRAIQVQVREGSILGSAATNDEVPRGPIRLLVELRSGEVLTIERAPLRLQQIASGYLTIGLAAAMVLTLLIATLYWQVVRPIARLASAAEAFRCDLDAADAPVFGAREVQALAVSFNAMKQQISGLVSGRTRMLAAIAHDLRTYLTRLRLRADYIGNERQRERTVADIDEMGGLLEDILVFARNDADGERNSPVIDARAEASAYLEIRREMGDDVGLSAPERALACHCAPLAFRRILANLVDNAIRYGTRARVTLDTDEQMVVMTVRDDGPGIPAELMQRLTEPFERIEESRGRHSGGAGLGLAIVKGLAESHGGSLSLENRQTGGLRAIVRLPRATFDEIVTGHRAA